MAVNEMQAWRTPGSGLCPKLTHCTFPSGQNSRPAARLSGLKAYFYADRVWAKNFMAILA